MSFVAKGMAEMTQDARFVSILWGPVGSGKTPLACTAPGKVVLLMFDIDGWKSVSHVKSLQVVDFTKESEDIVDRFMKLSDVESNLKSVLTDPEVSTIVFDSVTSYMAKALARGVVHAARSVNRGTPPTLLAPGLQGYGARGTIMRYGIMNLHALCSRYNKHFIATAHEKQDLNPDGTVEAVTMLLGGEAYVQLPKDFSEIWRVSNKDGVTSILTAPFNKYAPCRTRMFIRPQGLAQFKWNFNTYDWKGDGIETWMKQWKDAGCQAIPLPK